MSLSSALNVQVAQTEEICGIFKFSFKDFRLIFRDDYFRMKLQWKSVTPDQERRFSQMKERKNLIGTDQCDCVFTLCAHYLSKMEYFK